MDAPLTEGLEIAPRRNAFAKVFLQFPIHKELEAVFFLK